MPWIESHDALGNHPKTFRLVNQLNISVQQAVGAVHLLWHFALKYALDSGNLERFGEFAIARGSCWDGDPGRFVNALRDAQFICAGGCGKKDCHEAEQATKFFVHDWTEYTLHYMASLERRERNLTLLRERVSRFRKVGGGDPNKWPAIRARILRRDLGVCAYCGQPADEVDHVIPSASGGTDDDENLVASCHVCNTKKNNRTPEQAEMPIVYNTNHAVTHRVTLKVAATVPTVPNQPNLPTLPTEDSAVAPTGPTAPPVLIFPVIGKGEAGQARLWALTEAKLAEYMESFPAVDVLAECRKARQWCIDRPTNRKTYGGMPAFLSRWLSKEQDRGGRPGGFSKAPKPQEAGFTPGPLDYVILAYRDALEIPEKDRKAWNAAYWEKCRRDAQSILDYFEGDWKRASGCVKYFVGDFRGKGLTVTLSTVMNHAHDYKNGRRG